MLSSIWNFDFYNIVYFFVFYSFLGWCIEVAYYYKNERRFVNRGFLRGPFCPIYGCSIVSIVLFFEKYRTNILALFILGFVFTSLFEYITGLLLEKIFNAKWWDYSDDPLNIQGRVCLLYSLLWATGEVIIIEIVHPVINTLVDKVPAFPGIILFYGIIIYFLIDFSYTLALLNQISLSSLNFELAFNKVSVYFHPKNFKQTISILKQSFKKD